MEPDDKVAFTRNLDEMRKDLKAIEGRISDLIRWEINEFLGKWGVPVSYIETPVECYRPYGERAERSVLGQVKVSCSLF